MIWHYLFVVIVLELRESTSKNSLQICKLIFTYTIHYLYTCMTIMHNTPRRKTTSNKLPSNKNNSAHHVVALPKLNTIPLMLFRTNRLRTKSISFRVVLLHFSHHAVTLTQLHKLLSRLRNFPQLTPLLSHTSTPRCHTIHHLAVTQLKTSL